MMTQKLSLSTFTGALNTKFRMHADDEHVVEVELVEAVDELAKPGHEVFSLVFSGPRVDPLSQRIFRLDHDEIGSLELFLVPIAEDAAGVRYQAVFNRMVEAE